MIVKCMLSDKERYNLLPKTETCPVCGKTSFLSEYDVVVSGYVAIKMIAYKCIGCDESWTTTESDSITLNRFSVSKRITDRRNNRKLIINTLFNELS